VTAQSVWQEPTADVPAPSADPDHEAWVAAVIEDDPAAAAAAKAPGLSSEQAAELYPSVDWTALWSKAGQPIDWLCEPLLIAGRAVALFSPAKAGKSLLLLEICAALATGRPVLGNPAREPIHVLYVDLENTEEDLRERLADLGYGPDDDLQRLHYKSFPALPALDSWKGGAHLAAIAAHHDAQLVVIDTVSRVIEGEENSADTFRALYRHAVLPLKRDGRAVLRLDHSGRDLTRGQRGSSAKVDDVDAVWQLITRPGGAVDLKRTHSRNRHGADRFTLARLANPLRHMPASQAVAADVAAVIALLDHLELPIEWGRDRIKKALVEAGESVGNDLLSEAIRERKRAADLSADRSEPHDDQIPYDDDTDRENDRW
jgi:hypothetical protein